eukprot:768143-Hanusia_phi.AAC.6
MRKGLGEEEDRILYVQSINIISHAPLLIEDSFCTCTLPRLTHHHHHHHHLLLLLLLLLPALFRALPSSQSWRHPALAVSSPLHPTPSAARPASCPWRLDASPPQGPGRSPSPPSSPSASPSGRCCRDPPRRARRRSTRRVSPAPSTAGAEDERRGVGRSRTRGTGRGILSIRRKPSGQTAKSERRRGRESQEKGSQDGERKIHRDGNTEGGGREEQSCVGREGGLTLKAFLCASLLGSFSTFPVRQVKGRKWKSRGHQPRSGARYETPSPPPSREERAWRLQAAASLLLSAGEQLTQLLHNKTTTCSRTPADSL